MTSSDEQYQTKKKHQAVFARYKGGPRAVLEGKEGALCLQQNDRRIEDEKRNRQ